MMAGIDSKNREKESRFLLFFDFLTYLHFYKNGEKYYSFPRCYVQVFLTNIFPFQSPRSILYFSNDRQSKSWKPLFFVAQREFSTISE